jgi:hypothetical protein
MRRVVVAGSIDKDVVATADRHPAHRRDPSRHAVAYFPGGKGANQAVAAAKLATPTTLNLAVVSFCSRAKRVHAPTFPRQLLPNRQGFHAGSGREPPEHGKPSCED